MAITKIHAIKSTVGKSVAYICNPHKTDNRILVDTFACGIETAASDFSLESNQINERSKPNPAYHLIQSFAPGEVTFEEANKIGKELASRVLNDSHCYVLATHVDREHVHNHIIFSSINFNSLKRYHDCKDTYREIRRISDELCKEQGLSVIKPGVEKGKKYNEWQADKKNNSIKLTLKRDIFDCIRSAKSYEDFLNKMKNIGYEINGEDIGEGSSKYISFKPKDYGNFIRATHKNLGKGNTKAEIIERIEKQIKSREEWIEKQKHLPLSERNLINTSDPKIQYNIGLSKYATLTNLKIAAEVYASAGSLHELNEIIESKELQIKDNRSRMVEIDNEKRSLSEQIRYLEIYERTKPCHDKYLESKDKEYFLMENETNLTLFEGASSVLNKYGIKPESVSLEELKNKLKELEKEREQLKTHNSSARKELAALKKDQEKLNTYFNKEQEQPSKDSRKNNNRTER